MPDWKQRLHRTFEANGHAYDADVLEELSTHAAAAYEALCAEGAAPGEAERCVEDLIDTWVREAADLRRGPKRPPAIPPPAAGGVLLAGLMQDLRYGLRLLRRQPGFAAVAILTMALGIGATTILFSVTCGVLMKPLPWSDAAQLVRVTETREGRTGRVLGTVSNGTFLAWREQRSTIEDLGGWRTETATLTGAGDPVRVPIICLQRVLPWLLPSGFPRLDAVALDIRVLSFALAVSVLTSVACGLLPAWHTCRVNLAETLSQDGVASIGGARRSPAARTRALIMVGQVAIACLLLVGATLLTRSFVAMVRADRGYDPVNVLTARLPLPPGYDAERRGQLLDALVARPGQPRGAAAAGDVRVAQADSAVEHPQCRSHPRGPDCR